MSKSDNIENRGFLSSEIEKYRADNRTKFARQFAVCEEKSDTATKSLFDADMSAFDAVDKLHIITAIALWMRCLSMCQAAIILLERGLVSEAQILVRTAFEFLFYSVAVLRDAEVLESMIDGDSYARKEQAKSMAQEGAQELTKEQLVTLTNLIEEHAKGKKQLDAFQAARKAGMAYLYPTVYRGMSFIAAHPTLAATNSVFEATDDGLRFAFCPTDKGLEFCIGLVETCLAQGIRHFDPVLQSAS